MNTWFRMYSDFLDDPKMISLAFEDQRHFIGILALKCTGILDSTTDQKLLRRIVAQKLWIDHSIITEVQDRLVNAGLIDQHWQPVAWSKRQFVGDHTGAERQRRYRERKNMRDVTSDVTNDVTVTPPDTDTDTEEKQKPTRKARSTSTATALPDWISSDLWKAFVEMRKKIRSPLTAHGEKYNIDELAKLRDQGEDVDAVMKQTIANSWKGFFPIRKSTQQNNGNSRMTPVGQGSIELDPMLFGKVI